MTGKLQKLCDSYVSYYIFFWAVGIITAGIGFSVALAMSAKADTSVVNSKLETQINDTQWIKQTLSEIKNDIKALK
jgi:hypothetical protein